jgi:hypothetical protein
MRKVWPDETLDQTGLTRHPRPGHAPCSGPCLISRHGEAYAWGRASCPAHVNKVVHRFRGQLRAGAALTRCGPAAPCLGPLGPSTWSWYHSAPLGDGFCCSPGGWTPWGGRPSGLRRGQIPVKRWLPSPQSGAALAFPEVGGKPHPTNAPDASRACKAATCLRKASFSALSSVTRCCSD